MISVLDLRAIASSGGSLTLDAAGFSTLDLRAIASSGQGHKAQLVLKNVKGISVLDLRAIASSSPGNVHFELV
ncbi:hypothetical protein [Pseudomonas fluorescens]|uniref:hypothetical protein n=1 Tax=Pseudomonas fluorescens TaxID=294 RepID=UPI00382D486F